MKKPPKDPVREDRIHNEAIADANGPQEQVMGWYYYLDDKIRFPFQAKCVVAKIVSPLRKAETVEVQGMAPEDACSADMLVLIRWQGRTMAVPLSQLAAVNPDESTAELLAIGITGWRRTTPSEPVPLRRLAERTRYSRCRNLDTTALSLWTRRIRNPR